MRYPGRLTAAIEILTEIGQRHQPAVTAVREWGRAHRFAGSGDRGAIANLVHDILRRRASLGWRLQSDEPRALVLARALADHSPAELADLLAGDPHGPTPPSPAEIDTWSAHDPNSAPDWVRADIPEWLAGSFRQSLGESWVAEGAALAQPPPLDMRVNTLKADLEKTAARLARFGAEPARYSPLCLRVPDTRRRQRNVNLSADPTYQRGWVEIQDEASQIATLLVGAAPGAQVLDYCAGAGGKSLALSAAMGNRGQIHAYDRDPARMSDIVDRIRRSGAHNIQILPAGPAGQAGEEATWRDRLRAKVDHVLVDAPCSGSGAWRRRPDSKWRLSPQLLERRGADQFQALSEAAEFVRPGGSLVYVTCSLLERENGALISRFLDADPRFARASLHRRAQSSLRESLPEPCLHDDGAVGLSPLRTLTDGFFVAELVRN